MDTLTGTNSTNIASLWKTAAPTTTRVGMTGLQIGNANRGVEELFNAPTQGLSQVNGGGLTSPTQTLDQASDAARDLFNQNRTGLTPLSSSGYGQYHLSPAPGGPPASDPDNFQYHRSPVSGNAPGGAQGLDNDYQRSPVSHSWQPPISAANSRNANANGVGNLGEHRQNGVTGLNLRPTTAATAIGRVGPSGQPLELKSMQAQYQGEHLPGNSVWPNSAVKYLSDSERENYRLNVKNGKLYKGNQLFDTSKASSVFRNGGGKAIFVMDKDGGLFASPNQKVGEFHHSSLASGKPVAAAGEIRVENGVLKSISNASGHYRPEAKFIDQALNVLKKQGLSSAETAAKILLR